MLSKMRRLIVACFLAVVFGSLMGSIVDELDPQVRLAEHQAEFKEEEVGCLREALYYEGRGRLVGEQLMMAMVIMARVADKDPQWPKTICGVVHQPNQFSYYNDAELMRRPLETTAWGRSDALARRVMREVWKEQLLPHGAECVRSYKMSDSKLASLRPEHLKQLHVSKRSLGYFERTQVPVFTVGNHTFYRDKKGCVTKLPTT